MMKHAAALLFVLALVVPATAQNASEISIVQSGQSCAGCNLFQAELAYADAENLNLASSRLRQSNLALVTYSNVDFTGADLSVANLFGARFNRCDFSKANLNNTTAVGVYFGSSKFTGANLQGANLSGANLSLTKGLNQSQLDTACGDVSTKLPTGLRIPACR